MPFLVLLKFLRIPEVQYLYESQCLFTGFQQGRKLRLPHDILIEKDAFQTQFRDIVLEHLYQYHIIPLECDEPYNGGYSGNLITQLRIVLVFVLVYPVYSTDVLEYSDRLLCIR